MLRHPIMNSYSLKPSAFCELVRLYIDADVPYFIDLPDKQGRIRLTNIESGEYVIIDSAGAQADASCLSYIDEQLRCIYPLGTALRIRVARNEFRYCFIPAKEIKQLGHSAVLHPNKALLFSVSETGNVHYTMRTVEQYEISQMRLAQYKAVYHV